MLILHNYKASSLPVVATNVRGLRLALEAGVKVTLSVNALDTVMGPTVTPGPAATCVTPCTGFAMVNIGKATAPP